MNEMRPNSRPVTSRIPTATNAHVIGIMVPHAWLLALGSESNREANNHNVHARRIAHQTAVH
jgi:hypothetical protein